MPYIFLKETAAERCHLHAVLVFLLLFFWGKVHVLFRPAYFFYFIFEASLNFLKNKELLEKGSNSLKGSSAHYHLYTQNLSKFYTYVAKF